MNQDENDNPHGVELDGWSIAEIEEKSRSSPTTPAIKGDLHNFLKLYAPGGKSKNPNVTFTNGSIGQTFMFSIPEDSYQEFLYKLVEATNNEEEFCIDEKVEGGRFKLFMDLDLPVPRSDKDDQCKQLKIPQIVKVIVKRVSDFFPSIKGGPRKKNGEKWDPKKCFYDTNKLLWYGGWEKREHSEDPFFESLSFSRLRTLVCELDCNNENKVKIGVHIYWIGLSLHDICI